MNVWTWIYQRYLSIRLGIRIYNQLGYLQCIRIMVNLCIEDMFTINRLANVIALSSV